MYLTSRFAISLYLAGCCSLSGCAFYDYYTPAVVGIVTERGVPLADIDVSLTASGNKTLTARTDGRGRFSFQPQGKWVVFIPIGPQDRIISWSIAIARPDGEITGYRQGGMGGVFSGYSRRDRIHLICELFPASQEATSGAFQRRMQCVQSGADTLNE